MNTEVKHIVISLLKNSDIASSWGIYDIRITGNSVIFSVEAMKYRGDVVIKTTFNDKCTVTFRDKIDIPCTYDH